MSGSAHITSVTALANFRAGLCTFIDQAKDAQVTLDMEIRRTLDWLQDQVGHWKAEIRDAENAVIQAKMELSRRRMMRISDRPPDTTEQEKQLARAKRWLEEAQEKLAATKRWLLVLPDEIREYEGPNKLLQGFLERELPRMAGLLEQKINSLEAYTQIRVNPPTK
jgi:hypothetical protein